MATVKCEKYPELQIHDLGVTFHKGEATVTDKRKLSALKEMEGFSFEIEEEGQKRE